MKVVEHDSKSRMETVTHGQCMQYLRYGSYVGRVGFVLDGQPMIFPVNYLLEGEVVIFRTASGSALSSLDGTRVAFEVDNNRPFDRKGWGVVAQGVARGITEPKEMDRLRRGPLRSWAWGNPDLWFGISLDAVSGRRIIEI